MSSGRHDSGSPRFGTALVALLSIDARSALRDSMLRWMLVTPVLFALAVRYGLPPTREWLMARFEFDLGASDVLVASLLVLVTPMLFGTVIGFLLLDQRDDRTMVALQVTPLSSATYVAYRLGLPMVVGAGMTVVTLRLSGCSNLSLLEQGIAALGAAPLVAMFGLLLAGFAKNKVQGFALMKAAGGLNWPPLIAYFVDPPQQWLFAICPTFWPAKIYWSMAKEESGILLTLLAGFVVMAVVIFSLWRRVAGILRG